MKDASKNRHRYILRSKADFKEVSNSNNTIQDLLALSDWLGSNSITHVALDITQEDWKTIYHLLEANFNVLVLNALRVKEVPRRNTQISRCRMDG